MSRPPRFHTALVALRRLRSALSALLLVTAATSAAASFTTFESGQVRPLALSPDGTRLFAVDTPDDRLEIFSVTAGGLAHTASVQVGLEPVAVAARSDGEVWVVNHLSDSVSVVDVASSPPRVVRTLLVGDEPRDVVFAGPDGTRAFVTTAHRGQNSPVDPQLTTPGVGRADVWVFDATALGTSLGGTPLRILTLFGDTPRALAVAPGGGTVYAAVFHSGNETTSLSEGLVCDGGAAAAPCVVSGGTMPGGLPAPNSNFQGIRGPETGLIVRFDGGSNHWKDQLGRDWDAAVRFSLPDQDVFAIDADANPPVQTAAFAHVGTILFDMLVNPVTGKVYVTNTEARNEVRFEGPGSFFGSTTVQGHLHEARITVLDGAAVVPRALNPHIDYGVRPAPAGTAAKSLATPLGMAVNAAGTTLYVAAFGSGKIGVIPTAALESGTYTPNAADHIVLSGGGPSGVVLDEARGRLYVLTRFDNAVKVVDTATRLEVASLPLHDAEPASVKNGRPVLYDALLSSSNGEASCASCHVFGDFDSLAWDLGNPDDVVLNDPNPSRLFATEPFHPLKGPMTTQSLRGMANGGPMHWRGDRTGGNDPGGNALDESQAFKKFAVAFEGLLGKASPIAAADMDRFTDFILQVTYPPNPIRDLSGQLSPDAQAGRNLYFGRITDVVANCVTCHVLDPAQGFFGTDGFETFENETQHFKIPQLRNLYQKVGKFGMPAVPFLSGADTGNLGPQVRGFGFLHDGSIDTLFHFHRASVFSTSDTEARQLEQFIFEYDSNLAPIVGQQVTLTATNAAVVGARLDLLNARAAAGDCDLVVKGTIDGLQRGFVRLASGLFQRDRAAEATLADAAVRALAATPGQELTYTCVPPGSGRRLGVDRDDDGFFDRDEVDAGSDPADPHSTPGGSTTTTSTTTTSPSSTAVSLPTTPSTTSTTIPASVPIPTTALRLTDGSAGRGHVTLAFKSLPSGRTPLFAPAAPGSLADPTVVGAALTVYSGTGHGGDVQRYELVASGWRRLGARARGGVKGYRYVAKKPAVVRSVVFKANTLLVKGSAPLAANGFSLDEPSQVRVALRLAIGPQTLCAAAPAKTSGKPPSTAKHDHPGLFVAAPRSPAPASCVPIP